MKENRLRTLQAAQQGNDCVAKVNFSYGILTVYRQNLLMNLFGTYLMNLTSSGSTVPVVESRSGGALRCQPTRTDPTRAVAGLGHRSAAPPCVWVDIGAACNRARRIAFDFPQYKMLTSIRA